MKGLSQDVPIQSESFLSGRNIVSVLPVVLQLGESLVIVLTNLTNVHRVRVRQEGGRGLPRVEVEGVDVEVDAQHGLPEGELVGAPSVVPQVTVALVRLEADLADIHRLLVEVLLGLGLGLHPPRLLYPRRPGGLGQGMEGLGGDLSVKTKRLLSSLEREVVSNLLHCSALSATNLEFVSVFPVILELGEGLVVVLADLTHVHGVLGGHQEVLDLGVEVLGGDLACKDRQDQGSRSWRCLHRPLTPSLSCLKGSLW